MGLRSFYYKQEEKYFRFLDRLEKKGVNLYKIVDPLEKNGIPTFLLFNLILLLLIVFLVYFFIGSKPLTDENYTLTFVDSLNQPLANQSFRVLFNGTEKNLIADNYGVAEVLGVKKDKHIIGLNSDRYELEKPQEIDFSLKNNHSISLKPKVTTLTKTIYFKSNNELYNSPLTVSRITCLNNPNYQKNNLSTNDGSITLNDIPSDCGYLQVAIESSTINTAQSLNVSDESSSGIVNLSFADQKLGNASIKVLDKDLKVPISNIGVSIVNMQSQVVRESATNTNGLVYFNDVLEGTYKIVVYDNEDRYKPISEIENITITILDSVLKDKEILLEKAYIGKLNFKVIDLKTKVAIENVSVSLYKSDTLLKTLTTNKEGLVSFGVEENIAYKVSFNHPNYILKTENSLRINDSLRQVSLNPITTENLRSLLITVQDPLLQPVDFATIRLWDHEENIILQTIKADVYGKAVISNLDILKTYRLDAVKGKFTSDATNPFRINEQQLNEQLIRMVIGEGTFNLTIKSEFGDYYSGNVYVYDSSNDLLLNDKTTTTNQEGFTLIKIRADKEVYFVVDNFDSKFITTKYQIDASEIKNINFTIPSRVSQTAGIDFIGFYNALGDKLNSVSPGMQVTAKYILNVNKKYSKVTAHIRTGDNPTVACSQTSYNVLQDYAFIKEVRYSKSDIFGSLSYTPCAGQQVDFANKAVKNAKWFNLTLNNPLEGAYLIEADIIVLENAFTNQPINFRAEFYEGTNIVRVPVDTSFTSSTSKQNLYAQAKQVLLFTGTQSQCSSVLCYNFIVTNMQNNLSRNIIEKFNAQINDNYKLNFSFNVLDGKVAPNSTIVVTTGSSVKLNDYIINSATGGILRGDDFSNIEVGSLTSNDIVTGEINLKIVDDVSDVIKISVISNGQEIFSKTILVDIKKSKEMFVETVPRKLVPFISNDLIMVVSDDQNKAVSGANVNILLNNNPVTVGITDNQGLYGYVLPALNIGDVVRIVVSKNEYRMKDVSIVVDDKLLTIIPQEINLVLDSSRDIREVYNFSLLNESYVPLNIISVSQNLKNEFVSLSIDITDSTINGNSQNDIALTATLTEKGMNLYTQQTIKTDLAITVRSAEMNKTWVLIIPVNVRIVLGNSLDSLDCLRILPTTASLRTKSNETVTLDFTLENKCTSKNNPVDLGNIYALVDWQTETEAGVFSIVSSGREIILEDLTEALVLSSLSRNSKATLQLKFKAYKVSSDLKNPVISFKSSKGNINGVDQVLTNLPVSVIINNYSECIEVPKEAVPALSCNWFSGFNNYNQYYGGMQNFNSGYSNPYGGSNFIAPYNINNQFNPLNNYQQGYGYFTQQQGMFNPQYNLIGQAGYTGPQASTINPYNFPTSQYQNTFGNYNYYNFTSGYPQGNYGNMNYSNRMNCPVRPFYIKNNCQEAVDIKLDASYGVTISSDSEFTLEPGEVKETTIMGGESMGTFNIPVNAKPSLVSKARYSLVSNIPVSVTLPISFMPSKCIQVSPQKLDFSNIIDPKYQVVKVMNTCFDQGYRIVEVNYLDLVDLEFDGVSFLNVGEMQGRIQPIKISYPRNLTTNQPMEVWEVALRRNPEIKNTVSAKEYLNKYSQYSLAAGIVSTFRKMLIDVEDTVNLKFVLQVGLQPPHGQSSLIYNNVGMELTDNLQWLILDNKDNWDLIRSFSDQNVTDDDMFVVISKDLTYTLDVSRRAVFINVPSSLIAPNKFTKIDQETESTICLFDYVKNFPLNGIKETSFINDNGTYYLKDVYSPLKVNISFVKPSRHIFKLCFTRPIDAFGNVLVENNKLKIYDIFKESQNSNTDKQFHLWSFGDNNKSRGDGFIAIGVSTVVDPGAIDGSSLPSDTQTTPGDVSGLSCLAPDMSTNLGQTGGNAYKEYGFDKILFEYSYDKITSSSCDNLYCDQEQFLDSLSRKAAVLDSLNDTSKYVKLGEVYFEKDASGIRKSTLLIDLCADGACQAFDGKENLESYISGAHKVLNAVPKELKEITIIKTKGLKDVSDQIVTINGYNYTTVEYFLKEYSKMSLTDAKKAEVYFNMEVYFGSSPEVFVSSLKQFGSLSDTTNKFIIDNYNKNSFARTKIRNMSFSQDSINVSKPGQYLVRIKKTGEDLNISVKTLIKRIDEKYNKNILFTKPVNPSYTKSNDTSGYKAPFINLDYTFTDYSATDKIQDGYIFTFKGMGDYNFIDSRPFYFNKQYNFKIVSNNAEIKNFTGTTRLFLLNTTRLSNLSLHANPQITKQDTKNASVFSSTNISNNYMIYNLDLKNVNPSLNYSSMKDVFTQINNENVCFNISNNELLLWHNPNKFK